MISSRDVNDLLPEVAALCRSFIDACGKEGIDVIITSTYRDLASQTALYAQGRTSPGHIVTNAKPGESFHNYRIAFDFAPVVNGKVPWNDADLFTRCGIIGESVGLEWAGRWKHMRELAHLQLKGQSLTTLRERTKA
jgi:peptidoglycan L-alanyl-D-glutamate endopeptidase CwlK